MASPYRAPTKPDGRLGNWRRNGRGVTSTAPRGHERGRTCHNERTAASAAIARPTAPMADVTPRRQAGATALGCRAGNHHGFPLLPWSPLAGPGEIQVTH